MNLKEIAIDFLNNAAVGDVRSVYKKYVWKNCIHHNPYFRGDADSLMIAMEENTVQYPGKIFEIQRAIQEDNFVAVHSKIRMKPGNAGIAVVHIFRFKDNFIEEMLDIGQPIPEKSPNEHGMF